MNQTFKNEGQRECWGGNGGRTVIQCWISESFCISNVSNVLNRNLKNIAN